VFRFRSSLLMECFDWTLAIVLIVGHWSFIPCRGEETAIHALLAGRCLECHSGGEPRGGLDLSSRSGMEKGSDSGPVFEASRALDGSLWEVIESGQMPPKGKLTDEEKTQLRTWIEKGAPLPETPIDRFKVTSKYRAGYDWWALRPLQTSLPETLVKDPWIRNTIDAYVLSGLKTRGLKPNPPALPRSLLRRVYIDLIGLPPSYEDVIAFEADPSDENYRAIVEQLLASKTYGERWARHWLDVVRYGESDGFERNYPRHNSWHYRDWVIHALHEDLPYDTFVRMQIAGDVIDPSSNGDTLPGLSAVSFLVSGVHNTVVGSSDRMKRIAKQDELEEKIGTLSQAFLGLTAQCARCHEHKYDPISTESYYQLAASIQGVDHGEREIVQPIQQQREHELTGRRQALTKEADQLDRRALEQTTDASPESLKASPLPLMAWSFEGTKESRWIDTIRNTRGQLHGTKSEDPRGLVLDGQTYFATDPIPQGLREKTFSAWVTVDPLDQSGGGVLSVQTLDGGVFDAIVYGEREPKQWMAGSNGFARYQSFQAPAETSVDKPVHVAIRYASDGTISAFRNGVHYGQHYKSTLQDFHAGQTQVLFGLRHSPPGGNRFFRGIVHQAALFNESLSDASIAQLASQPSRRWSLSEAWEKMPEADQAYRRELRTNIQDIDRELEQVRAQAKQKVYTVLSNPQPGPTHILIRGDVYNEGPIVRAGGINSLGESKADFGLPPDATDAQRRSALADWIVGVNRPLMARVIVNRLWHYHFGTGIVDTPNDFGFNGGRPSHPELLDALAHQFVDGGMQIKELHRAMVLSSTYRTSTAPDATALSIDAQNRSLWRYPVRRLDGESARDSMLKIAGVLKPEVGGPGFVDVDFREINGTTYYLPKPFETEDCFRRTIYRFNPRCERSPLLDVLDCPDPSATAPRRANTTTPLQALSLLNNEFVFQMSDALVKKLEALPNSQSDHDNALATALFQQVLLRNPTAEETDQASQLVSRFGAAALARALWNSNEFLVLE